MINCKFRNYDYFTLGPNDEYGQAKVSEEKQGSVKMAIYPTSLNVQQNILYFNAQYVGFTHDKNINDSYLIQYGETRLKVLYVRPGNRLQEVFLAKVG